MASVAFTCTSLVGVNKVGELKKDENGYYEIVVGALNVFNSVGEFYVYEKARDLFESSSSLMRRVARGVLRGEYGHPRRDGMKDEEFAHRVMAIHEDKVCCHHKEVKLDFDRVKGPDGKPIIAIINRVKPSGPYGPALEKSFENKDENVCFSIRSLTDNYRVRGVMNKVLAEVVTWDYVNEPGLAAAEKFKSPALECFDVEKALIARSTLENLNNSIRTGRVSQESICISVEGLFKTLGWKDMEDNTPTYLNW